MHARHAARANFTLDRIARNVDHEPAPLRRARPLMAHCSEFGPGDALLARSWQTSGKSCAGRRLPPHSEYAANHASADLDPARILRLAVRVEGARTSPGGQSRAVCPGAGSIA